MSRATRLARHIEWTVTGPMWHGPALSEVLDGVNHKHAASRPIAAAHSIWELVLHITSWSDIARDRLRGEALGDPTPEQDWPPVTADGPEAWQLAIDGMRESYRMLAADARELTDDRLDAKVPDLPYSVDTLLHGIVEHGTYHGGQIALLRKAL
jgi:uncharacterized damage-inducible protein DinB